MRCLHITHTSFINGFMINIFHTFYDFPFYIYCINDASSNDALEIAH